MNQEIQNRIDNIPIVLPAVNNEEDVLNIIEKRNALFDRE